MQGYRKAQLIDVREPNEFDNGHILGARNIPMLTIENAIAKKFVQIYQYILYCQSGMRSGRAAQFLYKKGYKNLNPSTRWVQKMDRKS